MSVSPGLDRCNCSLTHRLGAPITHVTLAVLLDMVREYL
jgi:hypothetical protein